MSNTQSPTSRRRQTLAIVAIIAAGMLAGVLIMNGTGTPKANAAAQASAPGEHDHKDEHQDEHQGDEHAHGDNEQHSGEEKSHSEHATAGEGHAHGEAQAQSGERDGAHGEQPAAGGGHSEDEAKVAMGDAEIEAAGITLGASAPASIQDGLQVPGEIRFNEDQTAHVVARVAGVVESVGANLGQQVKKGQVLAVISSVAVSDARAELQSAVQRRNLARSTYAREKRLFEDKISPEQDVLSAQQALREAEIAVANASQKLLSMGAAPNSAVLGRFELRAPFDGVVVEKHIALGEAVTESTQTFIVSDLSTVWAEMSVPARDLARVRVGEKVVVKSGAFDAKANGTVAYVGSLIGEQTRTALARVALPNPQGAWRPGLFVNVEVLGAQAPLPVTVESSAIQTLEGQSVVFVRVPGGFMAQPVQAGRSDGQRVEIVSGLKAGVTHAVDGSFVIKSQQGKGSATHTH